jgi:hypothetical protein
MGFLKPIKEIEADEQRREALVGIEIELDDMRFNGIMGYLQVRLYTAIREAQNESYNETTRHNWHIVANEINKIMFMFD